MRSRAAAYTARVAMKPDASSSTPTGGGNHPAAECLQARPDGGGGSNHADRRNSHRAPTIIVSETDNNHQAD